MLKKQEQKFNKLTLMSFAQVKIQSLQTENLINPIGLGMQKPRFSWQLASDKRNIAQTAYEIIVSEGKVPLWKSGKVTSNQSVQVAYAGTALQSGKKYTWQVRVWDNNGMQSPWSESALFQTALLATSDWKAKWIEAGFEEDATNRPAILFRNKFSVIKKLLPLPYTLLHMVCMKCSLTGKKWAMHI